MPTSCFFTCTRPSPPPPPPPPSSSTTFYHTFLGSASLTWSHSLLGLSLSAVLPIPSSISSPSVSSSSSTFPTSTPARFHLRPSLLWRRRGSRRFRLNTVLVRFSWDLSRATFSGGGPEPTGSFFLSVSIDGESILVVGDAVGLRRVKGKVSRSIRNPTAPVSRREHVVVAGGRGGMWPCKYVTRAFAGGKERKVTLEIGGRAEKDVRFSIAIDGKRILQVKRLRWKFRGSERVEFDGAAILISWDIHDYLFATSTAAGGTTTSDQHASPETNHAAVLLRFEAETRPFLWTRPTTSSGFYGVNGLMGHVGTAEKVAGGRTPRQGRLMKTRSTSSTSSTASTGSGWSVADWQSAEENELKQINGFSLLISLSRR